MAKSTTRRDAVKAAASLGLLPMAARTATKAFPIDLAVAPEAVTLFSEDGEKALTRSSERWQVNGAEVLTKRMDGGLKLTLASNGKPLRVHLRWSIRVAENLRFLGDAWERSYGELAFRGMEPERVLPWYVIATDGKTTHAFGVKTAPGAFCFWQVDPAGISLWCDVRNGGRGVELGTRRLLLAEVVTRNYSDRSSFEAARDFCSLMSTHPRLSKAPIYGGNNWYYAYGHSSAEEILQDSERVASVSESLANRPFMVIDDGWQPNPTAGPWRKGNEKFPDMARLAERMRAIGVQPGIWTRPLFTREAISEPEQLRPFTLDPTVEEAAESIAEDLRTVCAWGYALVKHDFSTFDLLGRWGNHMGAEITDGNWSFHDRARTNAEVIRHFYELLRRAAGATPLLGCDTVGHLAAGLFEAQRIGDDTSGRDWNRTRRMGINTLAFRMCQHQSFFAIDADCVGLTTHIDWKWNKQWLDLLARSGTPLFVSIAADAFGTEQKAAVREAFALASKSQPVAEPIDWLTMNQPEEWIVQGRRLKYDWYGIEGASPFSE